jgi:DNA-directed RNA polymerase subunit RPC12/RpoP
MKKYAYKCTKCGKKLKKFKIGHEVTVEGPLCNECFKQLLRLNNAKQYFEFIEDRKIRWEGRTIHGPIVYVLLYKFLWTFSHWLNAHTDWIRKELY